MMKCLRASVAILLVIAVCAVSAQPTTDPCYLHGTMLSEWAGNVSRLRECLDTVPFSSSTRTSTLEVIDRIFQVYSFSDLIQASVPPYNLAIDWPTEVNRIRTHAYTSDYDFHADLVALFNSIGDAHLVYYGPFGYYQMAVQSPFGLDVRYVGGVQRYYTKYAVFSSTYQTFCGCDVYLFDYVGKEVTKINNVPVGEWVAARARLAPFYVDAGVQINNYLTVMGNTEHLNTMPLPTSNELTFEFADNTTLPLLWVGQTMQDITSANTILSLNTGSRKKEADGYGQEVLALAEEYIAARLSRAIERNRASRDGTVMELTDTAQRAVREIKQMQVASESFGAKLSITLASESARQFSGRRDDTVPEGALNALDAFLAENYVPLPHVREQKMQRHLRAAMDLERGENREEVNAIANARIEAAVAAQEEAMGGAAMEKRAEESVPIVPLRTGSYSSLSTYNYDTDEAGYGSYNGTTVLRLYSFSNSYSYYMSAVQNAHEDRSTRGLDNNLIIDVTNNGGGVVCLNYGTLSYLVNPWRSNIPYGPDVLYSPYDWRTGTINDFLYNAGNFPSRDCVDPDTGLVYGGRIMTEQESVTYGGHTSSYTKKFNWDLCGHPPSSSQFPGRTSNAPVFDKIIVVTDGRCGSSCAYFIAQLRMNDKVRVVSIGGDVSLPLATHSFAGGNVYAWSLIAQAYNGVHGIHALPTNAYTSYNFRENFALNSTIPRQFERLEGDWHVPTWDTLSLFLSTSSTDNKQKLANLYATVQDLFTQVPAGLPSIQNGAPPPPITPPSNNGASFVPTLLFVFAAMFACLL